MTARRLAIAAIGFLVPLAVAVAVGRHRIAHDLLVERARASGLGSVEFEVTALSATGATLERSRVDVGAARDRGDADRHRRTARIDRDRRAHGNGHARWRISVVPRGRCGRGSRRQTRWRRGRRNAPLSPQRRRVRNCCASGTARTRCRAARKLSARTTRHRFEWNGQWGRPSCNSSVGRLLEACFPD